MNSLKIQFQSLRKFNDFKMNVKIVFCDIDGTLLNDQHEITTLTRSAIQNLQNKKILKKTLLYNNLNKRKLEGKIIYKLNF